MASQNPVVKHHFWILFFATPLFIGLAFLLMLIFVSITLAAAKSELDSTKSGLSASPKTKGELDAKGAEVGELEKDRNTLWKQSYEEQIDAGVFRWPVSTTADFNALAPKMDPEGKVVSEMKFGEKFNLVGQSTVPRVLKDTFDKAYADLEKGNPRAGVQGIAPTRFAGPPGTAGTYLNALRTVTAWGTIALEPEPFWLLLEDYWVQRGLLAPIAKVNADAAEFVDVTPPGAKDADVKRNFRTRTWELDLEVETKGGGKQFLKGELRNRTARLQPLGVNKAMKVQVWFKEPKELTELNKAMADKVWQAEEDEKSKAARKKQIERGLAQFKWPTPDVVYEIRGESVPGKGSLACSPQEVIIAGNATRVFRAVQVFDEATVPVRLVNTIELGMLDHRHKADPYEMPKHMDGYEMPPEPGSGTGGSGTLGAGLPGGSSGESGQAAAPTGPTGRKFGSPRVVLFDNRLRYVKRTDDVRRMPVAVSVVVDNDYTNDLMVAYTNSPLHFQITQTQWARYKGTLPPVGRTAAPPVGGPGSGPTEGGPLGSPDGDERGGTGMPPGVPGVPGFPGLPTGSGSFGFGTSTGALPGEASANLCEFALFGVVSLYEKVPEEAAAPPGDGTNPMGGQPDPDPKATPVPDPMTKPDDKKPDDKKPDGEKKDPPAPTDDGKKGNQPDPTAPGK